MKGRPTKPIADRKTKIITIPMTIKDYIKLSEEADDIPLATYCRNKLLRK